MSTPSSQNHEFAIGSDLACVDVRKEVAHENSKQKCKDGKVHHRCLREEASQYDTLPARTRQTPAGAVERPESL
jgi:hypothetical protein